MQTTTVIKITIGKIDKIIHPSLERVSPKGNVKGALIVATYRKVRE